MELTIIPEYKGFLLMALPPGGFIMLGFMVAAKRLLDQKAAEKPAPGLQIESLQLAEQQNS
jgi:electron transport complex protein RnfE